MGKPAYNEAERVSWETKKDQPKKWEETQDRVMSGDVPESPEVGFQSNLPRMNNTSSSSSKLPKEV